MAGQNFCVVGGCLLSLSLCRRGFPKRRHIKFRRRGITQKKTYNILNTAKVWNQESNKEFHKLTTILTSRIFASSNGKSKIVPACNKKAYGEGGTEGIAPLIVNLGTRWSTVVSFTNPLSCPRERDPIQHKMEKMGGTQDWFRQFGQEENRLPTLRIIQQFLSCPAWILVTKLTELAQLLFADGQVLKIKNKVHYTKARTIYTHGNELWTCKSNIWFHISSLHRYVPV
jgi:hypothetical protein